MQVTSVQGVMQMMHGDSPLDCWDIDQSKVSIQKGSDIGGVMNLADHRH